jgi:hypothetical protein
MSMSGTLHYSANDAAPKRAATRLPARWLYSGLAALTAGMIYTVIADQLRVVDPFLFAGLLVLATRVRR